MSDDPKKVVVELDKLRANRIKKEKAAKRAIELHEGGETFDAALGKAVQEVFKTADKGAIQYARVQLTTFNTERAVARARKILEERPSSTTDAVARQAADGFEYVQASNVRTILDADQARIVITELLQEQGDTLFSKILEITKLGEGSARRAVDGKTLYFAAKQGEDWIISLNPPASKSKGKTPGKIADPTKAREELIAYLKKNGNSPVTDIARALGLKEKLVKEFVDKKEIHWIAKVDDVWTIGLEKKGVDTAPSDGKPVIDVMPNNVPDNIRDGIKALMTLKDVYVASGQLVRLFIVNDHVELVPLTQATLLTMLMTAAHWRTWTTDRYTKQRVAAFGPPPKTVVTAILERGIYEELYEILGISNGPLITYDEKRFTPVYHVKTGFVPTDGNAGYYVHGDWKAPVSTVHRTPDEHQMTCVEARDILESPLQGFRFENRDLGIAVVIATILTQFMRPMIRGPVPAVLVKAAKGKAGKTLLSRFIYAVAFGADCPIKDIPIDTAKKTLDKKEFANNLASDAFSRKLMQVYDNCDVEIGGDKLEMCLTSTTMLIRLFHTQKDALVRWLMTLIFNGNEPELVGNVARRMLRVQLLDNNATTFEWGTEDEFIAKVINERKNFVEALLVIVQSYFDHTELVEGSDEVLAHDLHRKVIPLGYWRSFGAWSKWIPSILQHAGFADALLARIPEEEADDPMRKDAVAVFELVELLITKINKGEISTVKAGKREVVKLTKVSGTNYRGMLVSDLIKHVCAFTGATRPEYEEGWRVLKQGVRQEDRDKIDESFVTDIAKHCRELKLNRFSHKGKLFVIGPNFDGKAVVAVVDPS